MYRSGNMSYCSFTFWYFKFRIFFCQIFSNRMAISPGDPPRGCVDEPDDLLHLGVLLDAVGQVFLD